MTAKKPVPGTAELFLAETMSALAFAISLDGEPTIVLAPKKTPNVDTQLIAKLDDNVHLLKLDKEALDKDEFRGIETGKYVIHTNERRELSIIAEPSIYVFEPILRYSEFSVLVFAVPKGRVVIGLHEEKKKERGGTLVRIKKKVSLPVDGGLYAVVWKNKL